MDTLPLTLELDGLDRVVGAQVWQADELRSADALQEAVRHAYVHAIVARILPGPDRGRSRAVEPPAYDVPPPPRWAPSGPPPPPPPRVDPRGPVTGTSRNECLRVTLPPTRALGQVTADPGWLSQTTGTNLSTALAEAFAAAYRERDES